MMLPISSALLALLSSSPATAARVASTSYCGNELPPAVALSVPSGDAQEDEGSTRFSYDFLEAELSLGTATGFNLAGSYGLAQDLYGTGRLQYLGNEEYGVDYGLLAFSVGATYVMEMRDGLDLLATGELEYGRLEASVGSFSRSDSEFGILLRGGARYAINSRFEAFGGVNLRTIHDYGLGIDGGVRYQFSNDLAFQASLDLGEETFVSVGVRYSL